jgi:exo-beta-1,3-glucanase (GH17 family)
VIRASVDANSTYAAAVLDITRVITTAKTPQSISAAIPNPMTVSSVNKTYALSATSSSGSAVTFTTSSLSTICEISGTNGTTLTVKPGGGTCVIRASVAENDIYAGAVLDVTRVITSAKTPQSISAAIPNPMTVSSVNKTYALSATSSSGSAVTFTTSSLSTICETSGTNGTTLTVKPGGGTCVIRASVAENDIYAGAVLDVTRVITSAKTPQRITAAIPNPMTVSSVNRTYTLSATSSSGSAVTFTTSSASTICETSGTNGTTLTVKPGGGTCLIRASVAENDIYAGAVLDVTRVITTP